MCLSRACIHRLVYTNRPAEGESSQIEISYYLSQCPMCHQDAEGRMGEYWQPLLYCYFDSMALPGTSQNRVYYPKVGNTSKNSSKGRNQKGFNTEDFMANSGKIWHHNQSINQSIQAYWILAGLGLGSTWMGNCMEIPWTLPCILS